jgi:hypothetical protein
MATLSLLVGKPAMTQTLTGQQLLSYCGKPTGFCLGFVVGYIQGLSNWQATDKRKCFFKIPAGVTNGQTVLVVKRFLEAHPQRLHEYSDILVGAAVGDAFPCK